MFHRIYNSHDGLAENVPFTNHKNKYFIGQMVAYTMVDVKSEQGQFDHLLLSYLKTLS